MAAAHSNPWLLAARLRTLPASVSPVIVGTALALREGRFDPLTFIATLAAAILLQVGANYANDVFDYLKGADRIRHGPMRVTQSGLLTPRQMLMGTAVVFGLAASVGVYLALVGGWPIVLIGALSIICAVAYTAGPFPLAYRGLGDLFAFLFFGVVAVTGAYFLQSGRFTTVSFIVSLPNALFATAIIVVNNLRDLDADREAGKRTLAARIGDRATRVEYTLMLVGAYLVPLVLSAVGAVGGRWAWLLPWASAPIALTLTWELWRAPRSPALNPILARTAQLNLIFSILFAVGLVAG